MSKWIFGSLVGSTNWSGKDTIANTQKITSTLIKTTIEDKYWQEIKIPSSTYHLHDVSWINLNYLTLIKCLTLA